MKYIIIHTQVFCQSGRNRLGWKGSFDTLWQVEFEIWWMDTDGQLQITCIANSAEV